MKTLQRIALVLTIVGALNWGLIGFFDFHLVTALFGDTNNIISRIIYSIIAIAGIIISAILLFLLIICYIVYVVIASESVMNLLDASNLSGNYY